MRTRICTRIRKTESDRRAERGCAVIVASVASEAIDLAFAAAAWPGPRCSPRRGETLGLKTAVGRRRGRSPQAPLTTIYRLRHIARTIYRSVDMSTSNEVPMSSASSSFDRAGDFAPEGDRAGPWRHRRDGFGPPLPIKLLAVAGAFWVAPPLGFAALGFWAWRAWKHDGGPGRCGRRPSIGANSPSARVRAATGRAARPATPFSTSAGARRCARSRRRPTPTPISSAASASRATARRSTASWPTAKRRRPPGATSPKRPTRFEPTPLPPRRAFSRAARRAIVPATRRRPAIRR